MADTPETDPDDHGASPERATSSDSGVDAFVKALFDAGPEAAEHLMNAARELLMAAKAVVDAGERLVDHARGEHTGDGTGDDTGTRVRRIDLS